MAFVLINRYAPVTTGQRELSGLGSPLYLAGKARVDARGLWTREGTAACYQPRWTGGVQVRLEFSFEPDDNHQAPFAALLVWAEASFSVVYTSAGPRTGIEVAWTRPDGGKTSFMIPRSGGLHTPLGATHSLVVQMSPEGVSARLDGGPSFGVARPARLLPPGQLVEGPASVKFGGPAYDRLSGPRVLYRAIDVSLWTPPGVDLGALWKALPALRLLRPASREHGRVEMEISQASNAAWTRALSATPEGREAATIAASGGGTPRDYEVGHVLGQTLASVASPKTNKTIDGWRRRTLTDAAAPRVLQYAPLLRGLLDGARPPTRRSIPGGER